MKTKYLLAILAIALLFSACKPDDEEVQVCISNTQLQLHIQDLLLDVPNVMDQRGWAVVSDLNGTTVLDCQVIDNNSTLELNRPCGRFHLTLITERCNDPIGSCWFQDIKTYTFLDTDNFYLKNRKTNRGDCQVATEERDVVMSIAYNEVPQDFYITNADLGVNPYSGGTLGAIKRIMYDISLNSQSKKVYQCYSEEEDAFYQVHDFQDKDTISTSISDFIAFDHSITLPNNFVDSQSLIFGVDINNGVISNWDLFPKKFAENPQLSKYPNPSTAFDKLYSKLHYTDPTGFYRREQLSDELPNEYLPTPIDFEIDGAASLDDLTFTPGSAPVTYYDLTFESGTLNPSSLWHVYGDFTEIPILPSVWPECITTNLQPISAYHPFRTTSFRHSDITSYSAYLENNFYQEDTPYAEWILNHRVEEVVDDQSTLEPVWAEFKSYDEY